MVRQKKAPAARRRPMSREEALARQERQQRRRELEQESRELAKGPIDLPFFILVMLLTGVGLVMLLSASFPSAYYETDGQNPMSYFIRQGVFAIMGVAAMLFIGKINYQRFRGLAKPLLYLAVILLLLVIIPGNPLAITRNNATRWLGIPGTSLQFQPSEIAKLAVVIYFADSISKKKDRMQTFRYGIAPYAVLLIVLAALVGIEPQNWNALWEQNFTPVDVDGRILIRAPFHASQPGYELEVVVMPRMAFGSGHHATTCLVASALCDLSLTGKRGLDMGCGTGVLAIVAAKRGAATVDAVDIDEWAEANCRENAAANGLAERIAPMLGDVSRIAGRKYDFIAANINRNILTMDMPAYAEALDTGGDLLMSGFLEEDVPVIEARARACGLEPVEVRRRDGWAMVHVKKA